MDTKAVFDLEENKRKKKKKREKKKKKRWKLNFSLCLYLMSKKIISFLLNFIKPSSKKYFF